MQELKRLFLGVEVRAPWPEEWPEGRLLLEEDRHLTLAFLGNIDADAFCKLLPSFPKYPFRAGLAAIFDKELFLPEVAPHVIAYHVHFLEKEKAFFQYQKEIVEWLKEKKILAEKREFLAHVTIARPPFTISEWKKNFQKLPCFTNSIKLYESLGNSRYKTLWEMPVLAPFESIPHTADLAFLIRGDCWAELDLHAWLSLAFHEPFFIEEFTPMEANSLEEVIRNLNARIARVDARRGSPFKAVSYHGQVENGQWEMIVDV
jgi:2'-5' RNA ligase